MGSYKGEATVFSPCKMPIHTQKSLMPCQKRYLGVQNNFNDSFRKHPFSSMEVLDTLSSEAQWTMGPAMAAISGSVKGIIVQKGQSDLSSFIVRPEPLIKASTPPPLKRPRMF